MQLFWIQSLVHAHRGSEKEIGRVRILSHQEAAEKIKKAIEIAPDLAREWSGPECLA